MGDVSAALWKSARAAWATTTLLLLAWSAQAQPKTAVGRTEVADVTRKLASGDEAQVATGIEECRGQKTIATQAKGKIVELLELGLPAQAAGSALDVLGELEDPGTSAVVAKYTIHRDTVVRRSATKALGRVRGTQATSALRHALTDADAEVRGFAAAGLGALGAHDALSELVLAVDKRVYEAATAIAQLCMKDECAALTSRFGRLPFDVTSAAMSVALFRKSSDLPDATKVKMIEAIRELTSPEAKRFLGELRDKSKGLSPAVVTALQAGAKEGSP
jgi:hypothetical protein